MSEKYDGGRQTTQDFINQGRTAPTHCLRTNQSHVAANFRLNFDEWRIFIMDKEIQASLLEQWKNGACLGYAIQAMEHLNYSPGKIQEVVSEMRYLFDVKPIEHADRHYCNSPY